VEEWRKKHGVQFETLKYLPRVSDGNVATNYKIGLPWRSTHYVKFFPGNQKNTRRTNFSQKQRKAGTQQTRTVETSHQVPLSLNNTKGILLP
jgi:hypothetical protein